MLQLSPNKFLFLPMLITTQRTALIWKGNKYWQAPCIVIKVSQILHLLVLSTNSITLGIVVIWWEFRQFSNSNSWLTSIFSGTYLERLF